MRVPEHRLGRVARRRRVLVEVRHRRQVAPGGGMMVRLRRLGPMARREGAGALCVTRCVIVVLGSRQSVCIRGVFHPALIRVVVSVGVR